MGHIRRPCRINYSDTRSPPVETEDRCPTTCILQCSGSGFARSNGRTALHLGTSSEAKPDEAFERTRPSAGHGFMALTAGALLMSWLRRSVRRGVEAPLESINGLPLPRDLLGLIRAERWRCPSDLSGIDRLFPDRGEFKLYSLDYMPFENDQWVRLFEDLRWLDRYAPMFLGSPDPVKAPGDIDPRLSVLIGDLGIGFDQPIALDYRPSMEDPPVVTLEWSHPAGKSVGQGGRQHPRVRPLHRIVGGSADEAVQRTRLTAGHGSVTLADGGRNS